MVMRNAFEGLSEEGTNELILATMLAILEKMPRVDGNDRLVANIETGSGLTVGLSTNQTLATLTTLATATRLSNLGASDRPADAIPFHMSNMGAAHIYNNIIVS